jgi:hypothetical protein
MSGSANAGISFRRSRAMPRESPELQSEFNHLSQLALRRAWVPPASAPIEVRITSADQPSDVPFEPLAALVQRLDKLTGVSLHLTGGGYGCFDLGRGQPPEERFLLRKVSAAHWELNSPLAR